MRITRHENQRSPLSVADDEGIAISVKPELNDADPREDLAETCADQHEQKISLNGDDVDVDKPQRISKKKKKKLVTRTKWVWVLNFKLLDEYPGSFFMVVRCKGCFFVTNIHSHTQEPVFCPSCFSCLCLPGERPGGRGKLTSSCSFWSKTDKIFDGYLYDEDLPPNFWEDAKRCRNRSLKPC